MTIAEPAAGAVGSRDELAGRLAAAISGAAPGVVIASVTLAVPAFEPVARYEAAISLGLEAALWIRPSEGQALVGVGRAWAVEAAGADRFAVADAAWADLAARLPSSSGSGMAGPLLLGGMGWGGSAARMPDADDPWATFPASSMVLPALLWAVKRGRSTLTASVAVDDGVETAHGLADVADSVMAAETAYGRVVPSGPRPSGPLVVRERPDRADWERTVAMLAGAVGRGRLDKVVLARRVDLTAAQPMDVGGALHRLVESAPESAVFAFTRADRTFLGATPERLVATRGRAFRTVAIAGSTRRGVDVADDDRLATDLLASDKDREEHAVVVDALREQLAPVAARLAVAPGPRVLRLHDVAHLVTDIEGDLEDCAGLLALAGRLHPTPAVGGAPTPLALELIAEHEAFLRGWYAGPVGWVDAEGDGELMVALRSGVVAVDRASLFAGCGIVADSEPGREWEESAMKLRPMLGALGSPGPTDAEPCA